MAHKQPTITSTERWRPIDETTPKGEELLLFFPAGKPLSAMRRVELYPVSFPRKPTFWAPLPPDPE